MILLRFTAFALFAAFSLSAASPADFERALSLYNRTDYRESLKMLSSIQQKSPRMYALMGQNHLMLGDTKQAIEFFDKAAEAEPANASYRLWLGRAWGRRAEGANPISAPAYAARARQNFEKAVQMSPLDGEAAGDLFEFYLNAPGFLGGGLDKAAALADQIGKRDPAEGHWARARVAEKRKEFSSAESQLRRAVELAPHQVGRVIDLAKFLAKRGRFEESDRSFVEAQRIAPDSPKVLYARADTYIHSGRNIDTARELLKQYISSKLTPDDPPRNEALKLLEQAEKLKASSRS